MSSTRKLWLGLTALLIASFGVLLWVGDQVHQYAPPLPQAVVTSGDETLFTGDDIERASRYGNASAASSWARSGATARCWRRTGAPTGCTAKAWPCWSCWRATRALRSHAEL